MVHVKHMGFELELAHAQICHVLSRAPGPHRRTVIEHLAPIALKRAVADTMGCEIDPIEESKSACK